MYCSKCGCSLPEDAAFCEKCGSAASAAVPRQNAGPGFTPAEPEQKKGMSAILIIDLCIVLAAGAVLGILSLFGAFPSANPQSAPIVTVSSVPAVSPSSIPSSLPPPSPPRPSPSPAVSPGTADERIAYFCEVALNSEYGGGSADGIVKRWEEPIRVEVRGKYTKKDYSTLVSHIKTLNAMGCLPPITMVKSGGNCIVSFVKLKEMPETVPGYVEGNWGFISIAWDEDYRVYEGNIGIATDVTSQKQRSHLILEEFTQGLGLLNDSPKYPDSIFQSEWTEVQELSALDYQVIALLYNPALKTGMTEAKAKKALSEWLESFE
jgi:hypothetical protein